MSGIIVRPEILEDVPATGRVNDEAFGRQAEGKLVASLRDHGALIVSLVAAAGSEVVGHIGFSPVTTEPAVADLNLACLAPVAVKPDVQNRGIGGSLVHAGLEACLDLGIAAVFLVGHPDYYPRFGFVKANDYGITCELDAPHAAWMVVELRKGTLENLRGVTALFHPVFREFV